MANKECKIINIHNEYDNSRNPKLTVIWYMASCATPVIHVWCF